MQKRTLCLLGCLIGMLSVSCNDESLSSQSVDEGKCGTEVCGTDETCEDGVCVVPESEDVSVEPEQIPASITIEPDSGLKTTRSGDHAEFCVVINQEPEKDVTIDIASQNEELGTVSPTELVFSAENWDLCQTVTVHGTTAATGDDQTYQIKVGPASGDEKFESLEPQMVSVTHVDDVNDGNCASGEYKDDAGKCITVPVTGIKLEPGSIKLLRGQKQIIKVTVEPSSANNKEFTASLDLSPESKEIWSDKKSGVFMTQNVESDGVHVKGLGVGAPDIILTVTSKSNKNIKAEATIHIKPYVELKGPEYTKKVTGRNFKFAKKEFDTDDACKNVNNKDPRSAGDLSCRYYREETVHVFNYDMYYDYVRPKMMLVNGMRYATRASVVAAARFLTLQFPFDIPYKMGSMHGDKASKFGYSHYSWLPEYLKDPKDVKNECQVRIFGLNLQNKVFNNYRDDSVGDDGKPLYKDCKDTNGNYITTIATNALPWSCQIHDENGKISCSEKNKKFKRNYSGMECSGLVTWALRNGRFNLGDWKALFYRAKHYFEVNKNYTDVCTEWLNTHYSKKVANSIYIFQLEKFVNNRTILCKTKKETKELSASSQYNHYDKVFEKMAEMKPDTDIINLANLDRKKARSLKDKGMDIKAGDILIREKRIPIEDVNNSKVDYTTGHVAMIIGLEKDDDGYPTRIYVGEASATGNTVTTYDCGNNIPNSTSLGCGTKNCESKTCKNNDNDSWKALVTSWRMDDDKDDEGNIMYGGGEAFLIKMDHVYDYFSRVNNLKDKDGNALDGNTYAYTDCWNGDKCE